MPTPHPTLTLTGARDHIATSIRPADDTQRFGVELEWLTETGPAPGRRLTLQEATAAVATAGPPELGGRFTIEPGGQLEASTAPFATAADACAAARIEAHQLTAACERLEIGLQATGIDHDRPTGRIVTDCRYREMQRFFDARGPAGVTMMTNTAAVQLNIGYGPTRAEAERRWHLLADLGPVLLAAFANSPGPGTKSARHANWQQMDPSRTKPVGGDLFGGWCDYALDAQVMMIGPSGDRSVILEPLTLRSWLADGHEFGFPTATDLDFHLTTLFPPVRARGWFELRMLDALEDPIWAVAALVVESVLEPTIGDQIAEAVSGCRDLWAEAAAFGPDHDRLHAAIEVCLGLTLDRFTRAGDVGAVEILADYIDGYVGPRRCPADDTTDAATLVRSPA